MIALLFPGQGAQEVGMGYASYQRFPSAKATFEEADEALGYSLSTLIFEGPEEELKLTAHTQPAILTTGIALYRALTCDLGVKLNFDYVAGHSLGEYTALVAAGALSLGDAVKLVRRRGQLMQEAVPEGQGAMAAILGLDDDTVREVCAQFAGQGVCESANFNCPKQVVISGQADLVEKACDLAKEKGARRAQMLKVSAPFHCSLMKPVAEPLSELMDTLDWKEPSAPLIANVNAQPVTSVQTIKEGLKLQSYSPVLWTQSVQKMEELGVKTYVEFGPGKVLGGMVKKIATDPRIVTLENADAIEAFAQSGGLV